MDRWILHCDLNNYFASVECLSHPEWKDLPVAVCGSKEERHGIVLAKNYPAKAYGIKTGEVIWQALSKCANLIIAQPHYEEYLKYSNIVKNIYKRYTDEIESMGIDECWLDITHSLKLFGNPIDLANRIRNEVREETGLTISVGVSFNKIFAKLASDMKKPDATTVILRSDFKDIVWKLPVEDMIGIGRSTGKCLFSHGCRTLGDIAVCPKELVEKWLGKNGEKIWLAVNGFDDSLVENVNTRIIPKSIGKGMTTVRDMASFNDVNDVIIELSQAVGYKLRKEKLLAKGISIGIRDNGLLIREYQGQLEYPSQSTRDIVEASIKLFKARYEWQSNVRTITVRAIELLPEDISIQLNLFSNYDKKNKVLNLEKSIDDLRDRYGVHIVNSATFFEKTYLTEHIQDLRQSFGARMTK